MEKEEGRTFAFMKRITSNMVPDVYRVKVEGAEEDVGEVVRSPFTAY
jgi:hypothetical protein